MKDSIVNELITAMKDRLPPGQNLANFLTDTLCIGGEASEVGYRCVIKMKRLYTIKVKELANFARILLKD